MKMRKFQFSLPLLSKELMEMANRRRTYIIRTIYALLFLGFVGFVSLDQVSALQNNPLAILGHGRHIFESMIYLQFTAIYLFLPAITCSVITHEKEHNSLGLLLITRLSPSTIILEKYLGRLITMVTFLMLGLPILAFAYSLGGVSPAMFINGLWFLTLTMFQVAALGVFCSSFFRTTVSAFIATYVFGFLMLFGPGISYELNLFYFHDFLDLITNQLQSIKIGANPLGYGRWGRIINFLLNLPIWSNIVPRNGELGFGLFSPYWFDRFSRGIGFSAVGSTIIYSIPTILSIFVFLISAHYFLVRRAFLPSRNYLLNLFKSLDTIFSKINHNRITRGIILVKEQTHLPDNEPIAWRETSKKSLGTIRYLLRILVILEVPTLFLCTLFAISTPDPIVPGAVMLLWLVWGLAVLLLAVSATSLISGERSHETLDVLLTTPISGKNILTQKIAGVKRLCLVLSIPLLTIVLIETWWKWENAHYNSQTRNPYEIQWLPYLIGSLLTIGIYLPMLVWLFCWIGIKIKSQTKAILSALGVIVLWCLLPFILVFPVYILNPTFNEESVIYGLFLSPASYLVLLEIAEFQDFGSIWIPMFVNSCIYLTCYLIFRSLCHNQFNRNLGRLSEQDSDKDQSPSHTFSNPPQLSSDL